jgi:RNA polymerase sigma-70 factor (ECF subfamily)
MADTADEFGLLVVQARRGDPAAVAELTRRYEPEVRLVARVLLGPALRPYLDSMDLVQSVHKSLLIGLRHDRFDVSTPEKLVALALTVARRKAAKRWRHLRRQKRFDGGTDEIRDLARVLTSLPSAEADPAAEAQLRDAVEHVLRGLGPQERRVLELRLEGHSTAETARALGLDADVLRVQLNRLRHRLRVGGVLADWI